MKKISKKSMKKLSSRMGISERKTMEERGSFPRPVIFTDRKKEASKKLARKPVKREEWT